MAGTYESLGFDPGEDSLADPINQTTYCINEYCRGDHLVIARTDTVVLFIPDICHAAY